MIQEYIQNPSLIFSKDPKQALTLHMREYSEKEEREEEGEVKDKSPLSRFLSNIEYILRVMQDCKKMKTA
jgi:hypothetical protein